MTLLTPRALALVAAASLAYGCSSREVPVRFAAQSVLSSGAREAPVADPTVALTLDPPLPGDPVGAWTGLGPDAGASPSGAHAHAP